MFPAVECEMPKLSKHFYKLYSDPEAVKSDIRAAYAKTGEMKLAAKLLELSVSRLREHCRMLGFDPIKESRAEREKAKK